MLGALAFSLVFSASAHAQFHPNNFTTPTRMLSASEFPTFSDDLELAGLKAAANDQLVAFVAKDLSGTIRMGGKKYPLSKTKTSLVVFLQLIGAYQSCKINFTEAHCLQDLNLAIRAKFNVFVPLLVPGDPRYGEPLSSFFTGYATQPISGKSKPDAIFSHPIYSLPAAANGADTRDQIDFKGALAGKGLELAYAANLFDLYLLQIEGGGYVTVDNNGKKSSFFLSYDGTNHQPWTWISKFMMSQGYISNPSVGAQRKYLRLHPEKQEEIYSQCPSYVFFKVTSSPPQGAERVPLTDGRSLATDSKLYPFKGLLTYVDSQRPVDTGTYDLEQEDPSQIPFQPFSRFFIDQDTGGAITGKGRADLYFGLSDYAQYAATYQSEKGNIYFLLAK